MLKWQISELTTVSPENASRVGLCLTGAGLIMWEMHKMVFVHISGVLLNKWF